MLSLAMNDASTFVFALNHNSESNKKCAQIIGGSEILLSTGGGERTGDAKVIGN